MMFFEIVRSIVKIVTRQFFRRIVVSGVPFVRDRPVVFAVTHPNQAVDSFVMGTVVDRELYFLAKSTLFANKLIARVLASLHMLPIYRRIDNADMSKNQETFAAVCQKLRSGAAILIFPEGTSTERRVLLPLKTGAARIALQAADQALTESSIDLSVCIQPVSITYENLYRFQSSVTVTAAEAIDVTEYLGAYRNDATLAVEQLTAKLEESLRAITVHIQKERHQPIVEQISSLFSDSADDRQIYARVARAVEVLIDRDDPEIAQLLARLGKLQPQRSVRQIALSYSVGGNRSRAVLLAPFVALGAILNFVPYQAVGLIVASLVDDKHNLASVKIGSSVAIYPLWYLSVFLIALAYSELNCALALVLITIGSAWCANRWWDEAASALQILIAPSHAARQTQLAQLRGELLQIEQRFVADAVM